MLFTYNAAFRYGRNPTSLRIAQVEHRGGCLKKYDIVPSLFVYVGIDPNETRKYVDLSPELLRQFFQHYGVSQGAVVLSDNGKSFFEQSESVLVNLGVKKHECYPAAVHHFLQKTTTAVTVQH